jgi:hypothetical protein
LDCDLGNKQQIAETIGGKWVMELPELTSLTRSDVNHSKAFMSRQHDDVRMVYKQHPQEMPRQCIIFGTTNNREYLRDATGNRRYLPILCNTESVDTVGIMKARRRIWKAARRAYLDMAARYKGQEELPLFLTGEAAEIAKEKQETARSAESFELWAEATKTWMDKPLKLRALLIEQGRIDEGTDPKTEWNGVSVDELVVRVGFRQKDFILHVLDGRGSVLKGLDALNWNKMVEHMVHRQNWKRGDNTNHSMKLGGKLAAWICVPDFSKTDQHDGFRIVSGSSALAPEIADPEVDDLI